MGGVIIDERCGTGVPGLYAAGEVAAGVHGTNRMGGNALTETQVFGAIAGESAVKAAISPESPDRRPLNEGAVKNRIREIMTREKGADHLAVRSDIVEAMSKNVSVIRNQEGLRNAISCIESIRETKADHLCMEGERSMEMLAKLFETENFLILGELTARAALLRTESRGSHQREDFPDTNKNWEKHIVFQLENNSTGVKTVFVL
jgi:fumarate reductase (CoM/CoB) subunit A